MNLRIFLILVLFCIIFLVGTSCDKLQTEKIYNNGMVVCADPIAAGFSLGVLKEGGNAIDAACAAALTMSVTMPRAGNIGGGGFAVVYLAESKEVLYLDFREMAPGTSDAKKFMNDDNEVDRDKALVGPLSSGVPGTVAGLYELHSKYGKSQWNSLVKPARMLADTGFAMYDYLAESLGEYREPLSRYESTRNIFFPDGATPEADMQFIQKDLAQTLGHLEASGRDGFYTGDIAAKIVDFCAKNGGVITMEDLQAYRPIWRTPVKFTFRDLDVYTSGLPSSGGIVMGQILSMLDTYELEKYTFQSPEYIHLFTEASRRAFADREKFLGDPDFTHDYTTELLSEQYIATRLQTLDIKQASSSSEIMPGMPKKIESDQTTHLVTTDAWGNIVSLTYTINSPYGSKAVVAGCGFILNNEMDDFAIAPGQPNAYGLVGGEVNKIEPGKRMLSSMTPTIILSKGKPYMALGARGGSKIITSVTQTIINHRIFGMSVTEAVRAPRIHHQWQPDVLYIEQGTLNINVMQDLISIGHNVKERSPFCSVMAIAYSPEGKFISGAGDNRMPGATMKGY